MIWGRNRSRGRKTGEPAGKEPGHCRTERIAPHKAREGRQTKKLEFGGFWKAYGDKDKQVLKGKIHHRKGNKASTTNLGTERLNCNTKAFFV